MDATIAGLIRADPTERLTRWKFATPEERFLWFYRPAGRRRDASARPNTSYWT